MKRYSTCAFFCILFCLGPSTVSAQVRSSYTYKPGDGRGVVVLTQDATENPSFVWIDQEGTIYLGLQLLEMTPELRQHFGVPSDAGLLVSQVTADGPADIAGLRVGDILTKIGGTPLAKTYQIYKPLDDKVAGDEVDLEYFRDGILFNAKATLKEVDVERYANTWTDADFEISPEMKKKVGAVFFSDDRKVTPMEVMKIPDPQLQKKIEMLEKRLQELEKKLAERDR